MDFKPLVVWPKGSMEFVFHDVQVERETGRTCVEHRFVSKENECPSDFIKRILLTSKQMNGLQVWNYLETMMKDVKT